MNTAALTIQIIPEKTSDFTVIINSLKNNKGFKYNYNKNWLTFSSYNEDLEITIFSEGFMEILLRFDSEETRDILEIIGKFTKKLCKNLGISGHYSNEIYIHENKPVFIENFVPKNLIDRDIKSIDFSLDSSLVVKIIKSEDNYTVYVRSKEDLNLISKLYPHLIEENNPIQKSFEIGEVTLERFEKITSF